MEAKEERPQMVIVTYPASGTLADLNQLVKEQEAALDGPLADIGNKDGWTTIDIDDLEPNGKPALPSLITTASPPAGAKVIAGISLLLWVGAILMGVEVPAISHIG